MNTERELYFDLYRSWRTAVIIGYLGTRGIAIGTGETLV